MLYKKLEEGGAMQPIKVIIYMHYPDSTYYMDSPGGAASTPDPYLTLGYESFDEYQKPITVIEGKKYLMGEFGYFYGVDTSKVDKTDVVEAVMEILPDTFSDILKK